MCALCACYVCCVCVLWCVYVCACMYVCVCVCVCVWSRNWRTSSSSCFIFVETDTCKTFCICRHGHMRTNFTRSKLARLALDWRVGNHGAPVLRNLPSPARSVLRYTRSGPWPETASHAPPPPHQHQPAGPGGCNAPRRRASRIPAVGCISLTRADSAAAAPEGARCQFVFGCDNNRRSSAGLGSQSVPFVAHCRGRRCRPKLSSCGCVCAHTRPTPRPNARGQHCNAPPQPAKGIVSPVLVLVWSGPPAHGRRSSSGQKHRVSGGQREGPKPRSSALRLA